MSQENYVFSYGGPNDGWNNTFRDKATHVKRQTLMIPGMTSRISIEVKLEARPDHGSPWAMLAKDGANLVNNSTAEKMLKVLERYDDWKGKIENDGFGQSFQDSYSLVG